MMTPADLGAAVAAMLPTDVLTAFARTARDVMAQRERNGMAPHDVNTLVVMHSLLNEDATRRARPERRPEIGSFDYMVSRWPDTAQVAAILGISSRQVSRVLGDTSRRRVRDAEDRRIRRHVWDPQVVEAERRRREEARSGSRSAERGARAVVGPRLS
jgi:hypothetical protein